PLHERPAVELAPGLDVLGVCFPESNPADLADSPRPVIVTDVGALVTAHATAGRTLVVCAHWGEEQVGFASMQQRRRASAMVTSGASHVVGAHSHVIGPGEFVMDARALGGGSARSTVQYGLGNFLFRVMPKSNARAIRSNRTSAAVLYEWTGKQLKYAGWRRCRFNEVFDLKIGRMRSGLPGTLAARLQMALPTRAAGLLHGAALRTRALRVGVAKVLEGVERPSAAKLRTAGRLMTGRHPR
ncbi:CapA family protein, partial [bacterium]|nr:CapA family protein [bacterium]